MSFSLYGSLPPSKTEKKGEATKQRQDAPSSSLHSLYSSLPPPETNRFSTSSSSSAATTVTAVNTSNTEAPTAPIVPAPVVPVTAHPTPQGWSAINKFRPVLRRPTIQAKPKINRSVIPAGATIVSVETVNKEKTDKALDNAAVQQETKAASTIDLGAIPLLSTPDDVNGFRSIQKPKKKGKKKNMINNQPQPIVFNMLEDYDPHRPNDYEQYKEERKDLRERQKRQRDWEKKQAQRSTLSLSRSRSRSRSPSYARSYSRSRSRSRSKSRTPSPTPGSQVPKYHGTNSSVYNQPSVPPPSTSPAKIDLNETAEDAYKRRLMLSQQQQQQMHREPQSPIELPQSKSDITRLATAQNIARKVLAKYGWQEGQGLGKEGEGIKEALQVKPIGHGNGVIIDSSTQKAANIPGKKEVKDKVTRTVLLTNMVGPGEVDDMLQEETAEECSKYGKVERCLIFEVPRGKVPDDKAVRIFVKFTEIEAAKRAVQDLNGRYFGGRIVSATFYDTRRFDKLDLAPSKEELMALSQTE